MKTLLGILRNKYFLVTTGFILWIFFFAEYDVISQYKQRKELNEMKAKIIYLEAQITELINEKNALQIPKQQSNGQKRYATPSN